MIGDDFSLVESETVYSQIDLLINYIANNQELLVTEVIYSTPVQYLKDIKNEYLLYQN